MNDDRANGARRVNGVAFFWDQPEEGFWAG